MAVTTVGRVGIEPTTLGLKVPCSTAELPARRKLIHALNAGQSRGSGRPVRRTLWDVSQGARVPALSFSVGFGRSLL
jgi:hypothetical protein